MKMKIISTILILLISLVFQAQDLAKIDSLILFINGATDDSVKVELQKDLADEYGYLNPEKAIEVAKQALELSKKNKFNRNVSLLYNKLGNLYSSQSDNKNAEYYFTQSLENEKLYGDEIGLAKSYINLGTIKQDNGFYSESLDLFNNALAIFQKNNMEKEAVFCFINIGITYSIQNKYDTALDNFLKGLKIAEKLNDAVLSGHIYLNLGVFYDTQREMDKALEYYMKQLAIVEKNKDYASMANAYNNIGCVYEDKLEYDQAIDCYKKGAELNSLLSNKSSVALCYSNIAGILMKEEKYKESEEYLYRSVELRKEVNDVIGLGDSYHRLGMLYFASEQYSKSMSFFKQAFSIRDTVDNYKDKAYTADMLSLVYAKMGDYKNAYNYHLLYKQYDDSLNNESSLQKITELQMQYEFDKERELKELEKQKTAIEHQAEIDKHELVHRSKNRIIYLFVLVIIVIAFFLIIVFRQYKNKKKANILLAEQNEEIRQQKEEITAQRDEIEAQRDIAANQRDIISEQKQELTDSIQYAQRIQRSTLPNTDLLSNRLPEHFILFKPRDIVSGDFYWFAELNDDLIITAADCTGHGVPGAFMSMLGISLLKEIVLKEQITNPALILEHLREEIIDDLHQQGHSGEQQDGMDMALININTKTKQMQFAGANNPVYLIRNGELIEYKGDKMPIAIYEKMDKFTTHNIQLQKGDIIYLFSDGFADQFGGSAGKKFKYKPFKELLLEHRETPMAELKNILDKKFASWKGNLEQVDDIIIMGLKI